MTKHLVLKVKSNPMFTLLSTGNFCLRFKGVPALASKPDAETATAVSMTHEFCFYDLPQVNEKDAQALIGVLLWVSRTAVLQNKRCYGRPSEKYLGK